MIQQFPSTTLPLLFKTEQPQSGRPEIGDLTESDVDDEDDDVWFVCRNCRHKLTRPNHRTTINGSHTHTFANPSGIVFEVACFTTARGYSFMGPASTEFAWFAGYAWRILICASCLTHLGWYFSSMSGSGFFALIVDKIELQS